MIVTYSFDWHGFTLDCMGEFFPGTPGNRDCPPEADAFDLHSATHHGEQVPVWDAAVRHINRDGTTTWYELAELIIERGMEEVEAQRRFDIDDHAACMGQAHEGR